MSNSSAWSYYVLISLLSLNQNIFQDKALRQSPRNKRSTLVPITYCKMCNASPLLTSLLVQNAAMPLTNGAHVVSPTLSQDANESGIIFQMKHVNIPSAVRIVFSLNAWNMDPYRRCCPFSHLIFRQRHRSPSFLSWSFPAVKFS